MHGIDSVYAVLVNRVPGIKERYKKKRNQVRGIGRGFVWIYLVWLNIRYYVFRDHELEHIEKYPYYEEKTLYSEDSESSISSKRTPKELAEHLEKYDVISFDVFDTLNYKEIFPEAQIIEEKFPSELLPYVFIKRPQKVLTFNSTGCANLQCTFECIELCKGERII